MRVLIFASLSAVLQPISLPSQDAYSKGEARIALLIGNGDYPNVPLKNPANDARDLAKALQALDFSVTLLVDGDYASMNRVIRDFGNAIKRPDAVALFYYSGHGVQYRGVNYIIPARADIQNSDELPFMAINVEQVYAKMESAGAMTNIIILDACRNNPFPGSERALERGLAVMGNLQLPQSLIVYATAPGKTAQDGEGRNGVFTSALLNHLAEPSLDVELMIRKVREDVIAATKGGQVPWHNSSISGPGFSFAGGGRLNVVTDPPGAEIYVDGQRKGISPLALEGLTRFSEIEISARSGTRVAARRVTLTDAAERKLELKLEVALGGIAVSTGERVTQARLDGAPVELDPAGEIGAVEVGIHRLELQGDSSRYSGKVEVREGEIARVEAVMTPMSRLSLDLPPGTSCRIEGMGIAETVPSGDFVELPSGEYTLSVTGFDYEFFSETVWLSRGEGFRYSPRLKYSAAYLSARYGAEYDRLAASETRGTVTQADVDEAGAFATRVRSEGRPELEPIAARADALLIRLQARRSLAAAAASGGASAATIAPDTPGRIRLTSDPPGVQVKIDGGEEVATPVTVELKPGSHSIEPLLSLASNDRYVLGQAKQWLILTPGSEMDIALAAEVGECDLDFRNVPPGFTVFVNGEEQGETPLYPKTFWAGLIKLRLERRGEEPKELRATVAPEDTWSIPWGHMSTLPLELQRATVRLDGKPDSWSDVQPFFEGEASGSGILLPMEYRVIKAFVCKDDKYLYFRLDFKETNPLYKRPKGIDSQLKLQTRIDLADEYQLRLNISYNSDKGQIECYSQKWPKDGSESGMKQLNVDIAYKNSQNLLVMRLPLSTLRQYLGGSTKVAVALIDQTTNGMHRGKIELPSKWFDLLK